MTYAEHYRLIGIVEDEIVTDFICGGNPYDGSECRTKGDCGALSHISGMGDFAALRDTPSEEELIRITGNYDSAKEHFSSDNSGNDTLAIITRNEYLEIEINGNPVYDVATDEINCLKLINIGILENEMLEPGDEEALEENPYLGTLWSLDYMSEIIYPSDERFLKLLELGAEDYYFRKQRGEDYIKEKRELLESFN